MSVLENKNEPLKVGMISLGCAKNLVDAEVMMGSLLKQGFQITNENGEADALIVNTCSFIDAAQEESVDTILESTDFREHANTGQAVIVSGCLSQRYRKELPKLMPEVDAFMGIDQVEEVGSIVRKAVRNRSSRVTEAIPQQDRDSAEVDEEEKDPVNDQVALKDNTNEEPNIFGQPLVEIHSRPDYIPKFETPRFRLTPKHFAYVKIAEGCNHPCSFCIIPRMRGSHRSRQQIDIIKEARQLVADGVKELNLISQDSTYYGLDLRKNNKVNIASPERFTAASNDLPVDASTLASLIRELNTIEGDFWIRILYTHPAHWTEEIISAIAECDKVVKYVDMPLQHIHDSMLERMRRETSGQYIRDLIKRIRKGIPNIAIRTTFIVGFPGETEEYFESLLNFMREIRFERLGVFTFSKEDGTKAGMMKSQLTEKQKEHRREKAMATQLQISQEIAASKVGKTLKVLIEKKANEKEINQADLNSWEHGLIRSENSENKIDLGDYLIARGEVDAPDIDGRVLIKGCLPIGEFANVKIIGHTDYDLIAEPII
ncbi:MAG: 30S ribosomal protein S12 methylthiotransferase RimO [Verrucomicrobiota bacterium]|nr:30S ribosomal protein S12 methylthiotransferase RimO [Verrucomicrobiota bacterium]